MGDNYSSSPGLSIRLAQVLIWVQAAFWIVLGGMNIVRPAQTGAGTAAAGGIASAIMFGFAAFLAGLGWAVGKPWKLPYFMALAVAAATAFLSITDQFGWLDLASLLINLLTLVLLLASFKRYRQPPANASP